MVIRFVYLQSFTLFFLLCADVSSNQRLCLTCIYIADPEPSVQEQALSLVRNLVDGCINSIEFVFAEDGLLLGAIGRQLQSALKVEIGIQVWIQGK